MHLRVWLTQKQALNNKSSACCHLAAKNNDCFILQQRFSIARAN
jgi:hypothetical protein